MTLPANFFHWENAAGWAAEITATASFFQLRARTILGDCPNTQSLSRTNGRAIVLSENQGVV
ncbi:hypothetical protein NKH54_32175 [Mesorhizobium sp. M1004]|uniref:hypothetical protein n=1 Tax=Mesorhizobium sp. M1004 TaxID=2957046 RepID=UPI0033379A1C